MIEFYLQVKWVHIIAVLCSGSLFFVRGLMLLNNMKLGMAAPLRYLSYTIDTILLTAALMLATMLPSAMFANGWLLEKIILLVVYIVLGSFALKRGRSRKHRTLFFIAAVTIFAFMISVARAHHPAGIFFMLMN
ncbi:MAG: SirB2 family protein [Arenimonas sp.]